MTAAAWNGTKDNLQLAQKKPQNQSNTVNDENQTLKILQFPHWLL